jgi:hypothetical protein
MELLGKLRQVYDADTTVGRRPGVTVREVRAVQRDVVLEARVAGMGSSGARSLDRLFLYGRYLFGGWLTSSIYENRMILLLPDGVVYQKIQDLLDTIAPTISRWKRRFLQHRIAGLTEELHPGQPPYVRTPDPLAVPEADKSS